MNFPLVKYEVLNVQYFSLLILQLQKELNMAIAKYYGKLQYFISLKIPFLNIHFKKVMQVLISCI